MHFVTEGKIRPCGRTPDPTRLSEAHKELEGLKIRQQDVAPPPEADPGWKPDDETFWIVVEGVTADDLPARPLIMRKHWWMPGKASSTKKTQKRARTTDGGAEEAGDSDLVKLTEQVFSAHTSEEINDVKQLLDGSEVIQTLKQRMDDLDERVQTLELESVDMTLTPDSMEHVEFSKDLQPFPGDRAVLFEKREEMAEEITSARSVFLHPDPEGQKMVRT